MRNSVLIVCLLPCLAWAGEPVTLDNFVRAETDTMFRAALSGVDGRFSHFLHFRRPANVKEQTVIRTNRDTLYSGVMLDLSAPVDLTLPDAGGRYMSAHVISQDHYMFVLSEPGVHRLTKDKVGTRYAQVIVRTFADPNDEADLLAANRAQDGLAVAGGGSGPYEAPQWDQQDLLTARSALNDLATLGFSTRYAFGRADEVKPIDFLVGAAAGWAGLPSSAAVYTLDSVEQNDGVVPHRLAAKNVPVSAFWSVTVYNADGYLEANERDVYSYNSVTAEVNEDGSHTIHFGACEDGRVNCIPITPGWNYTVRLYGPGESIQAGDWVFPTPQPLN